MVSNRFSMGAPILSALFHILESHHINFLSKIESNTSIAVRSSLFLSCRSCGRRRNIRPVVVNYSSCKLVGTVDNSRGVMRVVSFKSIPKRSEETNKQTNKHCNCGGEGAFRTSSKYNQILDNTDSASSHVLPKYIYIFLFQRKCMQHEKLP